MSVVNKLRTALQLGYSVVAAPALIAASAISPTLHRALAAPLLSGPYRGKLVGRVWMQIDDLQRGNLSQEEFIENIATAMREAYESGELDDFLDLADEAHENLDVTLTQCLGFLPLKWWYIKLHFMAPGNVHQLHRHRTVISAQVIVRGALDAEQYNLINVDDDKVALEPVPLAQRNQCQVLLSTDKYCNVHGFEPRSCGAVRFQFYLRGHDSLLNRIPKRGRHYVHLSGQTDASGRVLGRLGSTGRAGES